MSATRTQTWTREHIEQIPKVYRDFMLSLREVVDSESRPIKVNGIPWGQIVTVLRAMGHPYEPSKIAEELEKQGLVTHDDFGFYRPTSQGKILVKEMTGTATALEAPPFPTFLSGTAERD